MPLCVCGCVSEGEGVWVGRGVCVCVSVGLGLFVRVELCNSRSRVREACQAVTEAALTERILGFLVSVGQLQVDAAAASYLETLCSSPSQPETQPFLIPSDIVWPLVGQSFSDTNLEAFVPKTGRAGCS